MIGSYHDTAPRLGPAESGSMPDDTAREKAEKIAAAKKKVGDRIVGAADAGLTMGSTSS